MTENFDSLSEENNEEKKLDTRKKEIQEYSESKNNLDSQQVRVLSSVSLTKRLSYVFDSLVKRVDAFDMLEKRIADLEGELLTHDFPEEFEKKLDLYERYTRIHLNYIEALRRVVGQIDMEELSRAAGLASLFHKFKTLPPESLIKINSMIETLGKDEYDSF